MPVNWNIEVISALIGFFFFLGFSLLFLYLSIKNKNKIHFSLFFVFLIFTFFHILEAMAYLFLNFEIKRLSAIMYSLGLFTLILIVDFISKDKLTFWKSILSSFIIGCTIILALIPENIIFYNHKIFGYPTLAFSGFLNYINIFALFLVLTQLFLWFFKVWRKSPSEVKNQAFFLFITVLSFFISIIIIYLTGLWLIIPIGYLIAAGLISIIIIIVLRYPKLLHILSFSTYRIIVLSNDSGNPLFNLSWSLKSKDPDEEQIILAKWLPIIQHLDTKFEDSIKVSEIILKNNILHFKRGEYITAIFLCKTSTLALKNVLNNFVEGFEKKYSLLLKTGMDNNSYYSDAIELIDKFFPLGIVSPIKSDDSLNNYLEILIKQRTDKLEKLSQEYKEANRLKSLFIASMSHELRTPLNSIIGFSELILSDPFNHLDNTLKDYIQCIFEEGNYLLDLINRILDISKIEAGKLEIYPSEFELKDLIESIIQMLSAKINEKNLKLIYNIPDSIILFSDINRVRQILINLIQNAIKFTDKPANIKIEVQLKEEFLEIHIIDYGIGISKNNLNKLFQPFQQIDMSDSRKYSGTGLGLYLSKKIVNLLGGEIYAKSEFGKGSDFYFTLLKELKF